MIGICVAFKALFELPIIKTILATVDASLNITSLFRILKSKVSKKSLDYQIISALEESFRMACEELGWEYDSLAVSLEFDIKKMDRTVMRKDSLSNLLCSLTGMQVNNNEAEVFINCFDKAVSRNDDLFRYLMQRWMRYLGEEDSIDLNSENIQRAITTIPVDVNLIGRENDIAIVKEQLNQYGIVFVKADGGVGKTAVASKIANDIKNEIFSGTSNYKHIAWITSSGNLKKDLIQLNIPRIKEQKTLDDKLSIVYAFLQNNPVFMVIDNMDVLPTVEEKSILNTIVGNTRILITTRGEISDFYTYSLSEIDNTSAELLFYRNYLEQDVPLNQLLKRDDFVVAQDIIKSSSNNALLIELLGQLVCAENKNLYEFSSLLDRRVFSYDSETPLHTSHAGSHGYDSDEVLTMQEQIRRLYQMSGLSPNQMEILSFISIFPAGSKVFNKVIDWCEFSLKDIQWLLKRGWLKKEEDCYSMHPVVKRSIELQNEKLDYGVDLKKYPNLIVELINTDQYLPFDLEYSRYKERAVIPKWICILLENDEFLDVDTLLPTIFLMFRVSELFYKREGDYINALSYCFKALSISINFYGEISQPTAGICNRIAALYFDNYDYEKALYYINKDYLISVKINKNDIGMSHTYNLLGETYGKLGKYSVSKYYFLKALWILSMVSNDFDQEDERVITKAHVLDNLANMYNDRGKHEKSLKYHYDALRIYESILDKNDSEIATSYNNIALTYYNLGKFNEAQYYYEKSLSIRKTVLDGNHPFLIGTYLGLMDVYKAQDNKEALKRIELEFKEKYIHEI